MPTVRFPAASPPPSLPERGRDTQVLAIGLLLIVLLGAAAALLLWRSREDALETWRLYLGSFSATAAEHATQSVTTAQSALDRVVDRLHDEGIPNAGQFRDAVARREMSSYLADRVREVPLLDVLTLVDMDGHVVAFSRTFPAPAINVSDRDYFQAHRADPGLDTYLSAPVRGRYSQNWTFFLTRKVRSPSGAMIGLAIAGIQVAYFEEFYRSLNFDASGTSISLFRREGTLLARYPARPESLGQSFRGAESFQALETALRSGQRATTAMTARARVTDGSDAQRRMVAPHLAEKQQLVVVVAATEDLMLRHWRRTALFVGIATVAVGAVILAMCLWIRGLLIRRRVALATLEAAREAAESAYLVKSQFLANMSHEIRTPLHGMLGMTDLLLDGDLRPAQRESVAVIERSGRLLLGLIDDVLDFSRMEAGRLQLERIGFDLARVAGDCIALHAPGAREKNLVLVLDVEDAGAAPRVVGDPLRLSQIVNNLVSNAVKFTAAGVVTVTLKRAGDERWRLAVRDTGIGMTREESLRICQPFTQADSSTTRRFGGTGLGLSIVSRLVQLHGGELQLKSAPGKGSEFSCVLHLPPAPPGGAPDDAREPPARPRRGALRVLVAEDNPVNMLVSCALLQKLGMTTLQANDGRAAVALHERERADVILMDMHMPELDGLEATRAIRAIERAHGSRRTPIAALTANVLPEDRRRCLEAGMDDVLVKPFDSQQLAELLHRLAGRQPPARAGRTGDALTPAA